jgi:hypothetical protein
MNPKEKIDYQKKFKGVKKPLLFLLIVLLLFYSNLKGQNGEKPLAGRTFVVQVYEYNPDGKKTGTPVQDELTFVGGKLYSKMMGKEYQFFPGDYIVKADSSTGGTTISFVSLSKKDNEEMLLWQGSVTGDQIQGTMKWFAQGMTKIFFGTLKYKDQEK